MNILAIDPGPVQSAFVLWNGERVREHGIVANPDMAASVWCHATLSDSPRLAIEMIASYGMPVGSEVFETCVWIGRFTESWLRLTGLEDDAVMRIPRPEIKVHLCQTARAKDANVRQALLDRFGPQGKHDSPGPLFGIKSHEWSALAVAVCAHDRMRCGG